MHTYHSLFGLMVRFHLSSTRTYHTDWYSIYRCYLWWVHPHIQWTLRKANQKHNQQEIIRTKNHVLFFINFCYFSVSVIFFKPPSELYHIELLKARESGMIAHDLHEIADSVDMFLYFDKLSYEQRFKVTKLIRVSSTH